MDTVFIKAQASDLNTALAIAKMTIDRRYRSFLDNQTVDDYLSNRSLKNYLIKITDNTWALLLDHNIVGFSICIENVIDFMLIDVNFHRQGVRNTMTSIL